MKNDEKTCTYGKRNDPLRQLAEEKIRSTILLKNGPLLEN